VKSGSVHSRCVLLLDRINIGGDLVALLSVDSFNAARVDAIWRSKSRTRRSSAL
jgi:hypothetical protein